MNAPAVHIKLYFLYLCMVRACILTRNLYVKASLCLQIFSNNWYQYHFCSTSVTAKTEPCSTYMIIHLSISFFTASVVNDICELGDNHQDNGYIMSTNYPALIPGRRDIQCSCNLSAAANTTLSVRAIDLQLDYPFGCRNQSLTVKNMMRGEANLSCTNMNSRWIKNVTRGDILKITFRNLLNVDQGKFWLEYKGMFCMTEIFKVLSNRLHASGYIQQIPAVNAVRLKIP